VFHLVPTLLRYSVVTGDPTYRDLGAEQLRLFARVLADPESGLMTHAYYDAPRSEPVPAFTSRAFWARGNGWMLAALVDAQALLPEAHPAYAELRLQSLRLEAAVRATQAPSGLFHTLLLAPGSYEETAGSALLLYAMARGVRLGLFGAATYAALERAAPSLYRLVRVEGRAQHVTGTSLGTNPVAWLYARTLTAEDVSYGVGAWLLAVSELADVLDAGR
jgi:unsaturated rhamnogalacturonyl hydrolase